MWASKKRIKLYQDGFDVIELERREFLRIDCLVETHIISINENNEFDSSNGLTKNISASGVLFRTKKKYKIGTVLSIEIFPGILNELDENKAKVVKTRGFILGRVVRLERLEEELYDCAVAFISSKERDKEYLRIFQDLINKAMYFG